MTYLPTSAHIANIRAAEAALEQAKNMMNDVQLVDCDETIGYGDYHWLLKNSPFAERTWVEATNSGGTTFRRRTPAEVRVHDLEKRVAELEAKAKDTRLQTRSLYHDEMKTGLQAAQAFSDKWTSLQNSANAQQACQGAAIGSTVDHSVK